MIPADLDDLRRDVVRVTEDLLSAVPLSDRHVLVVGVSTSEVIGRRIGTSGNDEVGNRRHFLPSEAVQGGAGHHQGPVEVFTTLKGEVKSPFLLYLDRFGWEEVSAIPVPKAGGAMAAHAYRRMAAPALVESVVA